MLPRVSVGIPFFNPGIDFKYSIESVLNQTYANFELILIDDGSTDGSLEVAKSFDDPRIRVVSDGKNLGLPARLNQLVTLSRCEYIARMDADDFISMSRLEKQVHFLDQNMNLDLVSTGICSINSMHKVMGYRCPPSETINLSVSDVINGKIEIAHATLLVRRKWFERNKYDESARLMEDYQLWIDASLKDDFKVGFISEPLYFYREDNSISYRKLIKAYRNQIDLVCNKIECSRMLKWNFYLKVKIKIEITKILHATNSMNRLFYIRNRRTQQDKNCIHSLQFEADSFISRCNTKFGV